MVLSGGGSSPDNEEECERDAMEDDISDGRQRGMRGGATKARVTERGLDQSGHQRATR